MPSKKEIRASHRSGRADLSPEALVDAGSRIAEHGLRWAGPLAAGAPASFAAYLSAGSEPPTRPLLAALYEAGHCILLPVCEPGLALSWVYWTPATALARSAYAPIEEPAGKRFGTEVITKAAGIILPATAVDLSGNRIGQGGGYYDVFLASLGRLVPRDGESGRAAFLPTAAVVFDAEVLPAGTIPAEPFDQKVSAALTPGGLIRLGETTSGD